MSSQALEQILEFIPPFGQEGLYQTIDVYVAGTTALYTGKPPKAIEGPGSVLRTRYDLEQGSKLQERFDFSHGKPHVNYEIVSPYQKKPLKGILGDAHKIDLFKK